MRRAALALLVACAPTTHAPDGAAGDASARAIVAQRCTSCHAPSQRDLPVLAGTITPALARDGAQQVCAGSMPQDAELSLAERNQVVSALCALAGSTACEPCTEAVYARSPQALARIIEDVTKTDVRRTRLMNELTIHSPRHALSTKLDATYLLLYVLLAWEGCKTAPDPDACMATLLREERWQPPRPVR